MNTETKELIERAVNALFAKAIILFDLEQICEAYVPRMHKAMRGVFNAAKESTALGPTAEMERLFPECKFSWDPHNKKWMLVMYNGQSV